MIAQPICDLLKGDDSSNSKSNGKNKRASQPPPSQPVTWTSKHQASLENLIDHLVNIPLIAYREPNSPYVLHTYSYESGLGAVLYQHQAGILRVLH